MTRFWSKVHRTEGCWLWTASENGVGYGQFYYAGRMRVAHRVAYELSGGRLVAGLQLDHLCRNRLCVRPDHLEQVSSRENNVRAKAIITHCPKGHLYDEANTYRRTDRPGVRDCLGCRNARNRARFAKAVA